MSSFLSHIQTFSTSVKVTTRARLDHLNQTISNNRFLGGPFLTISDHYQNNEAFFKVFLGGCLGYVLYCAKEKIPSIPSHLFVGITMGTVMHFNLAEIKNECSKRTKIKTFSDLWQNIGIPTLTLVGAYCLLKKHDFVQQGVKSIGVAVITPIVIAILNAITTRPLNQ